MLREIFHILMKKYEINSDIAKYYPYRQFRAG